MGRRDFLLDMKPSSTRREVLLKGVEKRFLFLFSGHPCAVWRLRMNRVEQIYP